MAQRDLNVKPDMIFMLSADMIIFRNTMANFDSTNIFCFSKTFLGALFVFYGNIPGGLAWLPYGLPEKLFT